VIAPPDAGENSITPEQPQNPRRLHAVEPAPRSPERPLRNLPSELSSFVGREKELPEVKRLLENNRLLTLTGSGGAHLRGIGAGLLETIASLGVGGSQRGDPLQDRLEVPLLHGGGRLVPPAAVPGLAVCDGMILYVIRRMRVRSSY
jgi:hypothetical protein